MSWFSLIEVFVNRKNKLPCHFHRMYTWTFSWFTKVSMRPKTSFTICHPFLNVSTIWRPLHWTCNSQESSFFIYANICLYTGTKNKNRKPERIPSLSPSPQNSIKKLFLLLFLMTRNLDSTPFFLLLPNRGWGYNLLVVFLYWINCNGIDVLSTQNTDFWVN